MTLNLKRTSARAACLPLTLALTLVLAACGGGGGASSGGTTGTTGGSTTGGSTGGGTTGGTTSGTTGGTTGSADLFLNILPPGANGNSAGGSAQNYPANFADQLPLYGDLAYAQSPMVAVPCTPPKAIGEHTAASNQACNYFKSAGLDPVAGTVVSTLNLNATSGGAVTVKRDRWGVPYIVGDTRASAMYGFGYVSAQDRLWLHDVLRSIGRGRFSEFLGPAADTYDFDGNLAVIAGYSDAELNAMVELAQTRFGTLGAQAIADLDNMVAGVNAYIASLSGANAAARPPEYDAFRLGGSSQLQFPPAPWARNDIVASAILIQSIFANGGGNESLSTLLLQRLDPSFGPGSSSIPQAACEFWRDVRHADDPAATRTIATRYATQSPAALSEACPQTLPAGAAIWDVGSLRARAVLVSGGSAIDNPLVPFAAAGAVAHRDAGFDPLRALAFAQADRALAAAAVVPYRSELKTATARTVLASLSPVQAARAALAAAGLPLPARMSNFIAVNGNETASGHPIAVMGPQTSYFVPQLLFEVSIQSNGGTPQDFAARGTVFADLPYMNIGHGKDFAWSATSGTSDLTDTRVSRMCNVDGSTPSREDGNGDGFPDADGYLYDAGAGMVCRRFLRRTDQWTASPTAASLALGGSSQAQQVRRYVLRTHYGPVFATATVNGEPVAISQQRSTFFDELGTIAPFALASTSVVHDATSFQHLFSGVTGSFNWLYVDADDVAYVHSGLYPKRDAAAHAELPTWGDGRFEWASGRNLPSGYFSNFESGAAFSTNTAVPVVRGTGNPLEGFFEWPDYLSFADHPAAINPAQGYIASWNNGPAPGWWAPDFDGSFGPVQRVDLLAERLKAFQASGRAFDFANMVEIMSDAAYADLRAQAVLPLLLQSLRSGSLSSEQNQAANLLQSWLTTQDSRSWIRPSGTPYPLALGGLRRDRDHSGSYDQRAAAVLMDAWFPYLIDTVLPQLVAQEAYVGQPRYNGPGGEGSAFLYGWYQHLQRVLQTSLGTPGSVPYKRLQCAAGGNCRTAVLNALNSALARLGGYANRANWDGTALGPYSGRSDEGAAGVAIEDYDAIQHFGISLLPVAPIPWANRPTYQQVVEIRNRRP